jgi:two-component system, chemotaxis family, protein-glutamate methylesterase/glutaminase
MSNRDVLAIGTSAGGVEALRVLAEAFAPDLPAAVLVVIHMPAQFRSQLDEMLNSVGRLPARFAQDGEQLAHGRIYIGPPGHHLMLLGDRLQLGHGPRENFSRPAIDALLRSVAACCGHRSVGAVLTGTLGDGASGLHALKACGGLTVVQDPKDAAFPDMPRRALRLADPDHVATLRDLPALLDDLVRQPAGAPVRVPERTRYEVGVAKGGRANMDEIDRLAKRSVLACPDCHGIMWEIEEGDLVRYRCHLGHAYSAELMSIALDENLRSALGSALRALEERIALMHKLHAKAEQQGQTGLAELWAQRAADYERESQTVRESIRRIDALSAQPEETEPAGFSRRKGVAAE